MYKIWTQSNYKNYLYCYGVRLIIVPPLISLAEMLLQLVDSIISFARNLRNHLIVLNLCKKRESDCLICFYLILKPFIIQKKATQKLGY